MNFYSVEEASLKGKFLRWSVDPKIQYSIPGIDFQASSVLSALVHANCLPAKNMFCKLPDSDVLSQLVELGFVVGDRANGWAMAAAGMRRLQLAYKVESPQDVCAVRPDATFASMTHMELMTSLSNSGFAWCALPTSKQARGKLLPYAPERQKLWYSTPAKLPTVTYLQTLLQAKPKSKHKN